MLQIRAYWRQFAGTHLKQLPGDQVLNDAITPGEVVLGVEINHQPDSLPPMGFCGLIHNTAYHALSIALVSTRGPEQNDFRPNFGFGSTSVAGTVGIESLFDRNPESEHQ